MLTNPKYQTRYIDANVVSSILWTWFRVPDSLLQKGISVAGMQVHG